MTPKISAIIITKNEILNIEGCLTSLLGFVDEVIIVDSQSSDGTVELAEKLGAKVHQTTDWPGFGAQKNRALD
jgi:glycosyltransferase involved in cell wall biosynthesis